MALATNSNRWTPAEDKIIRQGYAARRWDKEIAKLLPGRNEKGVAARRRHLGLNYPRGGVPGRRWKGKAAEEKQQRSSAGYKSAAPEIARETILERDRAYLSPRTIGQELLGEPLPGRSYLDRLREQEASQGDLHNLSSRHPAWSPRAW